jgi:hypothetical protein
MCFKSIKWRVTLEVGPHVTIKKIVNSPSKVLAGKKAVAEAKHQNYRNPMVVIIEEIENCPTHIWVS